MNKADYALSDAIRLAKIRLSINQLNSFSRPVYFECMLNIATSCIKNFTHVMHCFSRTTIFQFVCKREKNAIQLPRRIPTVENNSKVHNEPQMILFNGDL